MYLKSLNILLYDVEKSQKDEIIVEECLICILQF